MPLPKIWNDYDRLDAADLNADMSYLNLGGINPSGCRGVAGPAAGVAIATGANVALGMPTAAFDPGGMLDAANNRVVCRRAGLYLVALIVSANSSTVAAGHGWEADLYLNAVSIRSGSQGHLLSMTGYASVVAALALAVNDALTVNLWNRSGSIAMTAAKISNLDVVRLGDALA